MPVSAEEAIDKAKQILTSMCLGPLFFIVSIEPKKVDYRNIWSILATTVAGTIEVSIDKDTGEVLAVKRIRGLRS